MLEHPCRTLSKRTVTVSDSTISIIVKMSSVRTISRKDLSSEELGFLLAGFVEGEGSFNVSLRRKVDYKVNWQVVMSFNVSKRSNVTLFIKVRKIDNLYSLDITNPVDIIQKVIPYFQKYPVLSDSKNKNFSIFCAVAQLMEKGQHRNPIGLRKILELREKINEGKGRTRKYGILDVFPS